MAQSAASNVSQGNTDNLPALYTTQEGMLENPTDDLNKFLETELIPSRLESFRTHMWAIGAGRAAASLSKQVAFGREIVVWEDINLHLVWNSSGKIFIKPLPRFLLDSNVWQDRLREQGSPVTGNTGSTAQGSQQSSSSSTTAAVELRSCALGFLYTYVCLITRESDFTIAKEKGLLPLSTSSRDSEIEWNDWKQFSREVLSQHTAADVHWRFRRGELRLSRLNFFSRCQFPLFTSYVRGWRGYSSLVRDNITWLVTSTVFIALVLTALQVGLATQELKENVSFSRFAFGFSVFAIVAPAGAFLLVVVEVAYNIIKDQLLYAQKREANRTNEHGP